jgi:ketosteroid isomerase-like protein
MKTLKLIIITLLLIGCNRGNKLVESSNKKLNRETEMIGIEKTRTAFQLAIKEGRYQDLQKFTTLDVNTVGPGSEQWNAMYKLGEARGQFPYDSIVMNPKETVIINDSIAYDFGTSTVYFTDIDGNPQALHDTFLAILKKDKDGVWKLHREVASSNVIQK